MAQLLEEGYKPGPCHLPGKGCIPEGYVLRAMEYLRDIIRRYNYARAYYTYGRIRASLGDYKKAEILISQVIRVEDPSVRDYELRLVEYYNMLFLVKNMARVEERLRQLDRIIKERLGEVEERLRGKRKALRGESPSLDQRLHSSNSNNNHLRIHSNKPKPRTSPTP